MNDTEGLWTLCAEALREQVSDAIWQAYLSGITPLSIKDHEILLGVPNKLIRDRVESRFLGLIQDTVAGTLGRELIVHLEVMAPLDDRESIGGRSEVADPSPGPVNPPARATSPPKTRNRAAPAAAAKTLSGVAGFFGGAHHLSNKRFVADASRSRGQFVIALAHGQKLTSTRRLSKP